MKTCELDQTKGTNYEYLETPFSNLLARMQEGHFFHYLLIKTWVCVYMRICYHHIIHREPFLN